MSRGFWRAVTSVLVFALVAIGEMAVGGKAEAAYIRTGLLTCRVSPGVGLIIVSSKRLSCTFSPDFRGPERYAGRINKVGIDIGFTGEGVIVWAVLAKQRGYPVGSLAGRYVGASAEASIVVGAGANLLIGGSNKSFALQPLSVQGQIGLNFAVAISSLDLWAQ